MNTKACIEKIAKYLTKNDVGVLVVDVQNSVDLSEIKSHFNVSVNTFSSASCFCKEDELPQMDALIDDITQKTEPFFLTGLSSFLKLRGEEELKNELSSLLSMTISGHVVILTFQCKAYLNFRDPRLSDRICIVDGEEDKHTKLIFTSKSLQLSKDIIAVTGIQAVADGIETNNTPVIYVKTAKNKSSYPKALFIISDLKKAYEALLFNDAMTSHLDESLGTDSEWEYALEKINIYHSWASLIAAEYGSTNALDLVTSNYPNFKPQQKWLLFIGLKLFGAKNNWCLDTAASRATSADDLIRHAYRDILDINPTARNFLDCYCSRKSLLNALGNPVDDVISFCKIVVSKEKKALYYLTDNTSQEKETMFYLLDKYGLDYSREELLTILKNVYSQLHAYLLPYRFKNALLDEYFQTYKYQKVINKVLPEFLAVVTEQAEKREYNCILEPRSSYLESISKHGAQLYFIDALGVEYLGFITNLCHDMGLMTHVSVCRCELPSITSKNKEFIEAFVQSPHPMISIKALDEIKHHGKDNSDYQAVKPPIYLSQELSIIEDIISKIKVKLSNGTIDKAVIIADHGASRLAVINETESQWKMGSNGVHSGRCCPKSEIDVQPDFATDADDFWALANYDRFKGGRKANFEVHGGATLEEMTIPIIEISYVTGPNEIHLMPIDAAISFSGVPKICVSYRRKAAMKIFSTNPLQDVSVCINGKYYNAIPIDNNFYSVEMPDIKRAKQYSVDVFACGSLVASELPIVIISEGSSIKDLL